MHHRILAALALVCVMAMPSYAKPNEAREGYQSVNVEKSAHTVWSKKSTSLDIGIPITEQKQRLKVVRNSVVRKSRTTQSNVLALAGRYLGTNPTSMRRLWCAAFVGLVEKKAGRTGTGSNLAKSYTRYGRPVPISQARAGDIVVTGRKGGGHVGYALGPAQGGKIKLRSGNTAGKGPGRRVVADGYYPVSRIIAVRRAS